MIEKGELKEIRKPKGKEVNSVKIMRAQTEREKEMEKKPRCLYDPLNMSWCNHHVFPPSETNCEECLIAFIRDGLTDEEPSEVMRWFIAYRKKRK